VATTGRPAGTPQDAPHELAMLAHELRRRVAALRVVGESIGMLRAKGRDPAGMVELLVGEIEEIDLLAREVLAEDRRGRPAAAGADLVLAVRAAARTVATARGVTIRVDAPPPPVAVGAAAAMLRQAVENLLDNAAAHGGAEDLEVAVRPHPDRGEVDVLVADRGQGPAAGGRAGERAGHGIGLFLVRRFLDDAGGRSWVAGRPGGGTVVGLSLPLRQAGHGRLGDAVNT
jgi:signal transduction histidine kinase